jgi:hypothetical protein
MKIAVESGVDSPACKKTDNFLTRRQLFHICSLRAVLEEKAECPVPSKPIWLALARDRPAGARRLGGRRGREKIFLGLLDCW